MMIKLFFFYCNFTLINKKNYVVTILNHIIHIAQYAIHTHTDTKSLFSSFKFHISSSSNFDLKKNHLLKSYSVQLLLSMTFEYVFFSFTAQKEKNYSSSIYCICVCLQRMIFFLMYAHLKNDTVLKQNIYLYSLKIKKNQLKVEISTLKFVGLASEFICIQLE